MAHWLYRIQPARPGMLAEGPTEREAGLVAPHFAYLKDLAERGLVQLAGRTLTTDERGRTVAAIVLPLADAPTGQEPHAQAVASRHRR